MVNKASFMFEGDFMSNIADLIENYILRQLAEHDARVKVVPARTPSAEVLALQPDGATAIFNLEENAFQTALQCLILSTGTFAYIIGHEAVHGVFMWHYSHLKPHFGFSFTYAYAGSDCWFAKNAYLAIALAPVAVWFVVFSVLTLVLPAAWFWIVWFWQIMNISGAAGDFYVFARILRMPEAVLVQDTGTAMTICLPA